MASPKKSSACLIAMVALLLPASAWAHWRGGFHGGGFRGGFVGHRGFGRGFFGYDRPHYGYRPFYGYPGFGSYASYGYGYWPSYFYWPSPSYYGPPTYVHYYPSYPVVIRYRVRDLDDDREARGGASRPAAERFWLIAFRDKSIRAVTDYWLEDSVLHYVGREGTKSSTELSGVDIPFSKQLNQERGLDFRLPGPAGYQPRPRDSFGQPQ
jgi:hypothetical protein